MARYTITENQSLPEDLVGPLTAAASPVLIESAMQDLLARVLEDQAFIARHQDCCPEVTLEWMRRLYALDQTHPGVLAWARAVTQ